MHYARLALSSSIAVPVRCLRVSELVSLACVCGTATRPSSGPSAKLTINPKNLQSHFWTQFRAHAPQTHDSIASTTW